MDIKRISSRLSVADLLKATDGMEAIILSPGSVESVENIKLAFYLASKAFEQGSNISEKFKYEFLLWLCGSRNIKSAMRRSIPDSAEDIIFVSFGSAVDLDLLLAKEKKLLIREKSNPAQLEKISLSRLS